MVVFQPLSSILPILHATKLMTANSIITTSKFIHSLKQNKVEELLILKQDKLKKENFLKLYLASNSRNDKILYKRIIFLLQHEIYSNVLRAIHITFLMIL